MSAPGGEFIQWSADGSSLTWSVGPRFFQYIVNGSLGSGTNDAQQIADLSLSVDSDRPQGTVAFTNARVITMNSARDVIDNGVVIVEDNRIAALGATGDVPIPDGATQVDLGGKTLMPGYIDAHAHGCLLYTSPSPRDTA